MSVNTNKKPICELLFCIMLNILQAFIKQALTVKVQNVVEPGNNVIINMCTDHPNALLSVLAQGSSFPPLFLSSSD